MKPHILVIEDDPDIAESIRYNLEREGAFTAQVALNGEDGLAAALGQRPMRRTGDLGNHGPDLIVLDLNLPGMSGFELCRRLRAEEATARTPIIMLTARTDESDKVRGLELGADDYVTKPFSVRELVARVRAALRRSGYDSATPSLYDDGSLRIDYPDFTVTCQGQPVKLTRKEFALLAILSRQKGRVVPREQLLDQVWGLEYYGEARTLDVHISGLRKKLGPCGGGIETVIGIGYRFRGGGEANQAADDHHRTASREGRPAQTK
jgi:DNA-binding response OmpR family regulator